MEREALVLGGGAREHVLVWGLKQSGARVYATPGNGGIGEDAEIFSAQSPEDVKKYFGDRHPLVVIGPEAYLAAGWADALRADGFPVVGPSARAAQLESSKRRAKEVMRQYGIPTAEARVAHRPDELGEWIGTTHEWPMVMKKSGLAQGKGVVIVQDPSEARAILAEWTEPEVWSDGVLFEEYLEGYELSCQVVTNGQGYAWLPMSRDYKRLTPDPTSPNTGGMGAVAPVPVDETVKQDIARRVLDPVMAYLTAERLLYRGVLYAGIMMTNRGPKVLEFNVRLGDPESQVVLPLLEVDWWELWHQVSQGIVPAIPEGQGAAVAVVMAAEGYPKSPKRGMPIVLGPDLPETYVFHAGTEAHDHHFESQGGRVLTITGRADTMGQARAKAYARIRAVDFPNSYIRRDIGESTS